ncbi:MAG: 16S rRNA (cytosine(1402)-N(4))-methyltransferase RsmH [Planctomycetes bacterium]|nr:16S rRNA (cytosine(1402)-N(4))-methyltransferase RsmH [Planctomycetota bacterium]
MGTASAHTPVLLDAVVELLRPASARWIVDCTVGLGGHAEALLEAGGDHLSLIGIDRDEANLRRAADRLIGTRAAGEPPASRVRLFHGDFRNIREVLQIVGVDRVDGILADLGVASTQLDDAERGFSFAADAPLDMRMDPQGGGPTAADLLARLGEQQLADLLYRYADERLSRRIARAIVAARAAGPILRTRQLADLVQRAVGPRGGRRIHPATRTFQALRIAVNDELAALDDLLAALGDLLAPGGRAAVISFHSLEDRRVKHAMAAMKSDQTGRIITPRPVVPDDTEIRSNPRSRSAKLRCVERL